MGLFEEEFEYKGKHAIYCKYLKENNIISTYREIYLLSAVVGFVNGRKAPVDKDEKIAEASILPSEISKKKAELSFVYRVIMLLDEKEGFTVEDYKNRTFRDDSDEEHPEKLKENMEIFNSYARGGIEILYDLFYDCDEKSQCADALYEFVHNFAVQNELLLDNDNDELF